MSHPQANLNFSLKLFGKDLLLEVKKAFTSMTDGLLF